MAVFETYASRVARSAKAGTPDVYTYDELPTFLRTQLSQIFGECIGSMSRDWDVLAKILGREIESFSENPEYHASSYAYLDCMHYLKASNDLNGADSY